MRASEFLRSLADTLAGLEDGVEFSNPAPSSKIDDNVGEYTPPLQAKIEILKKANNITSVYDKNDNTASQNTGSNHITNLEDIDDGPFEG